jgi:two-component system, NtrC family, response regulator AtoC
MVNRTVCVAGGEAEPVGEPGLTEVPAPQGSSFRGMVREAVREVEGRIILETLARHQWNRRRTAEALRISYRSLMYKMKYCKLRQTDVPADPKAN